MSKTWGGITLLFPIIGVAIYSYFLIVSREWSVIQIRNFVPILIMVNIILVVMIHLCLWVTTRKMDKEFEEESRVRYQVKSEL